MNCLAGRFNLHIVYLEDYCRIPCLTPEIFTKQYLSVFEGFDPFLSVLQSDYSGLASM